MSKIGIAGNCGKEDRSDCQITLELTDSGGIQIELTSKVKTLYGKSIEAECRKVLDFFGIGNALVKINDNGALPFTLAARLEAAIKQVTKTTKEFLPPLLRQNNYSTARDCWRRTRLYLPGNSPKLMINAGLHKADGIILDLEDSVSPSKKEEARLLVRNTLRQVDFYGAERMVRINQIPHGLGDLKFVIPHNVNLILIPKCESADQVQQVDNEIKRIADKHKLTNPVWLMPIIESALGVLKAYEIASASPQVVALAIGLEDYTADLGTQRTAEGRETFYARQSLLNAARAAGVQAIDSVFSDVGDMEALQKAVQESKALGFDGMGCIHPRQIKVIQDNFAPDATAINKARKIVKAFEEAEQKGQGVVALGSKMIDPPIVKRALRTIKLAESLGLINSNWREENV
ncbi:MAG: aldolase/citrate lyase family protein [Candidatus Neomarinimicrobiota bacterium]